MKPSLKKLQKFFKLEAERGYDNGAVFGGLDKMLETWVAEARVDDLDDGLIQAVTARLRDYPRLSPVSREEALKGLWNRILREAGMEAPVPVPEGEPQPPPDQAEPPSADVVVPPAEEALPPAEVDLLPVDEEPPPAAPIGVTPAPPERPEPEGEVAAPTAETPAEEQPASLGAPVTVLPGVGERHAQTLGRLGIHTLGDMLYYFPRRYDDYSQLKPINRLWFGEEVTVIGTVQNIGTRKIRAGRKQLVEAVVSDSSGGLRVSWFNQPWIARRLRKGTQVVLSGKVDQYLGRLTMTNPEWELLEKDHLHTNRIVPVYGLTARLTQRWLRRIMHRVVSYWAPRVRDPLPSGIREAAGLIDLPEALLQIHFPDTWEQLNAARHKLAFDEIFLLQLGVLDQKHNWQNRTARAFETPEDWLEGQIERLPFELTGAQRSALADVRTDLASGHPMNRLLQGDVGSGKTVVAGLGVAMATRQGAQAALMAPTSILAEQHYQSMLSLLVGEGGVLTPDQIRLMIGATPEAEKSTIREGLESGTIKLVVGTHALIEDPVAFSDLELVIVDEQHRFGVNQRAALRAKGTNPHLMVTTATPIPRSLALTVYGDLDLTVMDEMPPGRQLVDTHVLLPQERERAYALIRSQANQGHQAFIIYPLVEESEKSEARAAVEEHRRLQEEVFPGWSLGLLHGRLKPDEKDQVMARFRDGEDQILVSTSVVEVGVDIPNATVMLIEGANRFGLAQLHQFRGRVGRGAEKAYCLLIPDTADAIENERLEVMVATNNGFVLAERDLEHRGPGEFLGTRQSGFTELRMANLTDVHLIEKARRHAQEFFTEDPELTAPQHHLLAVAFEQFWSDGKGDIS